MMMNISADRLAELLINPRENLEFEIKNWLDLQHSNEDKAVFAKALLAISNHGGGFIALGLQETADGIMEAEGRPVALNGYSQDLVNGIVQNYCDPPFHCAVHFVPNPEDALFPIVVIPGGHRTPIRARRAGPNERTVTNNAIYVRKPGPRSEIPHSAQEWDDLLGRCFQNRRDEMFDQIRSLIAGAVPPINQPVEPARLDEWIDGSWARWQNLVGDLPESVGPRLIHGRYCFAYEITGDRRQIELGNFNEILRRSKVRYMQRPPFSYFTHAGIVPYLYDGAVECWIDAQRINVEELSPAYSDFWRIHPDGLAFQLTGFLEDSAGLTRPGGSQIEPGTLFDISIPILKVGEALLHASTLANAIFEGPTTIQFVANFEGLEGRSLTNIDRSWHLLTGLNVARQNSISLKTHIDTHAIEPNLPEILHPLLSPLYALFNFFELPMQSVVDNLKQ